MAFPGGAMRTLKGSTQRIIRWTLLVVIAAFGGLCALLAKDALPKLMNAGPQEWIFLVCLFVGGTALAYVYAALKAHFRGCVIAGVVLNEGLEEAGLQLPLFVTCLFAGILITNLMPANLPRITGTRWPSRKPAIALIADISLGTFLAMSLMSMQLWTLIDLAGPIFTILAIQFAVAIAVNLFVVFPAMGRNYDAAVVCSGFGGISLGSTPTAMANMAAVSQRYGASRMAFIVVPLVCAFFIDLANAVMIPYFLGNF